MNSTEALKNHGVGVGKYKVGQYVPVENLGISLNANVDWKLHISEVLSGMGVDSDGNIYYCCQSGSYSLIKCRVDESGTSTRLFTASMESGSFLFIDKENNPYYRTFGSPGHIVKADKTTGSVVGKIQRSPGDELNMLSEEGDKLYRLETSSWLYSYNLDLTSSGYWYFPINDSSTRWFRVKGKYVYILYSQFMIKYDLTTKEKLWTWTQTGHNLYEFVIDEECIIVRGNKFDGSEMLYKINPVTGEVLDSYHNVMGGQHLLLKEGFLYRVTSVKNNLVLVKADKTNYKTICTYLLSPSHMTYHPLVNSYFFRDNGIISINSSDGKSGIAKLKTHYKILK